jgi:hypothetical protein
MRPLNKSSCSEIHILLSPDEDLDPPLSTSSSATSLDPIAHVSVGPFAAIKLSPGRTGEVYLRILKHARQEDLFPAEYILRPQGRLLLRRVGTARAPGKYDVEVHVEGRYIELLRVVEWGQGRSISGRSSVTTLVPEEAEAEIRTGIFVRGEGGEVKEYTNDKIDLRVLDFEVVDSNQDEVFEPGAFFLVKNIRVQNLGIVLTEMVLICSCNCLASDAAVVAPHKVDSARRGRITTQGYPG